jgi:hypothetical protein
MPFTETTRQHNFSPTVILSSYSTYKIYMTNKIVCLLPTDDYSPSLTITGSINRRHNSRLSYYVCDRQSRPVFCKQLIWEQIFGQLTLISQRQFHQQSSLLSTSSRTSRLNRIRLCSWRDLDPPANYTYYPHYLNTQIPPLATTVAYLLTPRKTCGRGRKQCGFSASTATMDRLNNRFPSFFTYLARLFG